jgi:hypothetical protein
MRCVAEMASGDVIYIRRFMVIGSDIQVTLSLLPEQYERFQCFVLVIGGIYEVCR